MHRWSTCKITKMFKISENSCGHFRFSESCAYILRNPRHTGPHAPGGGTVDGAACLSRLTGWPPARAPPRSRARARGRRQRAQFAASPRAMRECLMTDYNLPDQQSGLQNIWRQYLLHRISTLSGVTHFQLLRERQRKGASHTVCLSALTKKLSCMFRFSVHGGNQGLPGVEDDHWTNPINFHVACTWRDEDV